MGDAVCAMCERDKKAWNDCSYLHSACAHVNNRLSLHCVRVMTSAVILPLQNNSQRFECWTEVYAYFRNATDGEVPAQWEHCELVRHEHVLYGLEQGKMTTSMLCFCNYPPWFAVKVIAQYMWQTKVEWNDQSRNTVVSGVLVSFTHCRLQSLIDLYYWNCWVSPASFH